MNQPYKSFFSYLEMITGISAITHEKLFGSFFVIFILIFIRWIGLKLFFRSTKDVVSRYRIQKGSSYIATFLVFLLVGRIWFQGMELLVTVLGFVSAGLAIALQELVKAMAGWIYALWRHPFRVGDRIQIGDYSGDVIDIRMFKFTILEIGNWVNADQSTGRIIHLSNSMILDTPIANYTEGFQFIWNELPVTVTFESDWKKAKTILEEIANRHSGDIVERGKKQLTDVSRNFMIFYKNLTPIVYTSVIDIGINLTIRYIVEPRKRRITTQELWEEILEKFANQSDIDFAYPTVRYYDNRTEGKQVLNSNPEGPIE